MKTLILALLASAGLTAAAPVVAQDAVTASAAAPAATSACELHVWPAERFQSLTTGWLSGLGVVGALADSASNAGGDKARRSHLATALDSESQLDALQKLELVNLLGYQGAQVVTHIEPLDRKTVNKIKTRRAASASPCYAELIVADVFYHKAALSGRSLKTLFMLRDFRGANADPAIYKKWGDNGLKVFPAKPGEDTTAADAELITIFQRNFEEAARNFAEKRKTKG